ncbi:MAG: hypothetical protein OER85_09845 [Gammaproteobacteria bacterium]|nr:hypothetical protein [Gammaproteobacteria bacterium]
MNIRSAKNIQLALVLCTACILSIGASVALAGEITGNGKSLKNSDGTLNGKSICAFSGLNDTYTGDPTEPDEDGFFRTQAWGQLPKDVRDFLISIGEYPAVACNPSGH